jgi:hypothetical protein
VAEVPFSSERKLMSTVHRDTTQGERLIVFTKGAPDVLLTRCTQELVGADWRPLTAERRAEIVRVNEELAGDALRTLGVAAHWLPAGAISPSGAPGGGAADERVERDLIFAGLIGMIDPPRAEAAAAVASGVTCPATRKPVPTTVREPRFTPGPVPQVSSDRRVVVAVHDETGHRSIAAEVVADLVRIAAGHQLHLLEGQLALCRQEGRRVVLVTAAQRGIQGHLHQEVGKRSLRHRNRSFPYHSGIGEETIT